MTKDKKYYWLKLDRNFFKRHDVRIVEDMPNGKEYVLFFMKLLVESIDHEGRLRFNDLIPYNEQMLGTVTNTNIDIVRSAIKIFEQLDLLSIMDDKTIYIHDTQKMLGAETEWAKKKRAYNARKNLNTNAISLPNNYPYKLGKCNVLSSEQIQLPNGSVRYVDEKRYGGNGMLALARSEGMCEVCGSGDEVVIHHANGYSNDIEDLEVLCTKCHGKAHTRKMSSYSPRNVRQELEKEKEKELEIDIEKEVNTSRSVTKTKAKSSKKIYGEFKHIRLTDEEYSKLQNDYGNAEELIKHLDEYIEMKGAKYKSHYLAIKKWVVDAVKERKQPKTFRAAKVVEQPVYTKQEEPVDDIDEYLNYAQEFLKGS